MTDQPPAFLAPARAALRAGRYTGAGTRIMWNLYQTAAPATFSAGAANSWRS